MVCFSVTYLLSPVKIILSSHQQHFSQSLFELLNIFHSGHSWMTDKMIHATVHFSNEDVCCLFAFFCCSAGAGCEEVLEVIVIVFFSEVKPH